MNDIFSQKPEPTEALVRLRDVQVHFPLAKGFFNRNPGVIRAVDGVTLDIARGQTPVSYTHLDVYKRQIQGSRRVPKHQDIE